MDKKIALSTALSWNHKWDPIYSLDLLKTYNLKDFQLYISNNYTDSLIKKIHSYEDVNILIHSPNNLCKKALDPYEIDLINRILLKKDKYVVYHHDYSVSTSEVVCIVKKLNQEGITVLLENFYMDKTSNSVKQNLESYIEILKAVNINNLGLIPLLDIPRLFIEEIYTEIDSLKETFEILNTISDLKMDMFLHLIDSKKTSQNRECWCAIGKGYLPYDEIFKKISDLNIKILLTVLEYEMEEHIAESLNYFSLK